MLANNSDALLRVEEVPWESHVSELIVLPDPVAQQVQKSARLRVDVTGDDIDPDSWCHALSQLPQRCRHIIDMLPTYLSLAEQDRKRRSGSFWLSFASVAFVVGLCAVLITTVASVPVVFLSLAELENGLVDLTLSPGGSMSGAASLNDTLIADVIASRVAAHMIDSSYDLTFPSLSWSTRAYSLAQCGNASSAMSLWSLAPDLAAKVTGEASRVAAAGASASQLICRDGCFQSRCGNATGQRVSLMALDPERTGSRLFTDAEDAASLASLTADGGFFELPASDAAAQSPRLVAHAVLNENAAADLHVTVGDHIVLAGDIGDALRALLPSDSLGVGEWRNTRTLVEARVTQVVSASLASAFMGSDTWVVVNYAAVPQLVAAGLSPAIPSAQRNALASRDPYGAAQKIHFTMTAPQRDQAYYRSGYAAIRAGVMAWAASLLTVLGPSQLHAVAPILNFMSTLDLFSIFLGLIIKVMICVFAVLSVLLNYALLTMGIERRRYEIGVQRMLGFTRTDIVCLVLTQSYLYTVPAWCVGLVGGQLFYWCLRAVLQYYTGVPLRLWLSWDAICFSTFLALLIPLAASVLPIRTLIMRRLAEALDTTRGSELSGVRVTIKSPQKQMAHRAFTMSVLGVVVASLGVGIYCLFPIALITANLSLMFSIFFAVLLGMICGLVLLTSNLEGMIQYLVAKALLIWWEHPGVVRCTLKNLVAHRMRNRRTTLLYTLAVSLVIFLTVLMNINLTVLQYKQFRNIGNCLIADFRVKESALGYHDSTLITPLTSEATLLQRMRDTATTIHWPQSGASAGDTFVEYSLDGPQHSGTAAFLKDYAELTTYLKPLIDSGIILGTTYRVRPLDKSLPAAVQSISQRTYGQYTRSRISLNLVPPDHYSVLDNQFVVLRDAASSVSSFGLSGALYTDAARRKVIMGTSFATVFALASLNDTFLSETRFTSSPTVYSVVSPLALLDTSPSYYMSRFPRNLGELLASIPTGLSLSGTPFLSARNVPLQTVFVRLSDNSMASEVKATMRQFLQARNLYASWADPDSSVKDIKTAFLFLSGLLLFAQLMVYTVCFFSLTSSMSANVLASSKEIGVLLSLGMAHGAVYRTFIWEALVLVVSAGVLGTFIGLVMAYTLQIQNALLNQISIPFSFATRELLLLFAVGIFSALAASYSPVRFLLTLPSIAQVFNVN